MGRFTRNKFGAKKTVCGQGHKHPSKLEASFCDMLNAEKKCGAIDKLENQVRFPMFVNGSLVCTHIVDFVVRYKGTDKDIAMETKGMETDVWKLKHKLFLALYPDVEYRIVK